MNVYLFGVLLMVCVFTINAVPKNKECTHGQTKKVDCNNCSCVNGKWVCTTNLCSPRPQCISGQYKNEGCSNCRCLNGKWSCIVNSRRCPSQRAKRGVPGAADLKHTPCAPNDYFTIDCNTCYCNIDKTGYLCTENICSFPESSSSEPPSNDTLNANNTSVDDTTVPQIQTISLNSTVLEIENTNNTAESTPANHSEIAQIEPLVITQINYTKILYSNSSSNLSDTDGGGTSKTVNITGL